ncbi:MAG TPA: pitrilysin family protein [Kofleriaceae bacterium]|nr:pitrilysin family protein [Kofleriaceae bacterium]
MVAVLAASSGVSCLTTPHSTINWIEKRATLDNGLRLVVVPDSTTTLVQVDVRYEVGSNEDPPNKSGLAHLVEHMMFQHRPLGPDKPPTFELIPQVAVAFNAYTTYDQTHYWMRSSKEDLEAILRLEAFRMASGCETIPPAEFDREREVVRNEIRGHFATADGLVIPLLSADVYPAGHPYSHDTGGNDVQLTNIEMKDVCEFMKKYYLPERAILIVAGNVDGLCTGKGSDCNPVDEVGKLVQLNFGAINTGPNKRTPAPRAVVPPITLVHKTTEHELDIEKPYVFVTWKLPPRSSPDWTKVRMLYILAGKLSRQAEDWKFAEDVEAFPLGGQLAPVFTIMMQLHKNSDIDEALDTIWKLSKTASWGLKNGLEFDDESKAVSEQYFVEGLEPLDARTAFIADQVQFERNMDEFKGNDTWLFKELDKIKNTSVDGYASFVKDTLQKDKAVVTIFKAKPTGAKGDTRGALAYAANANKEPEPLVDPAEAKHPLPVPKDKSMLDQAEHYTLGNGMKVTLLPYAGLPIVSAQLVFANAGSAAEPASKAGLAQVAANFLHLPYDADVERTGIFVEGFAGDEATTFLSSGMQLYTAQIIKALERTIKAGTYEQESIESYQRRVKQAFESKQFREDREYQRELQSALYGPDHPFTTTGDATPQSVGGIGYDAVTDFQRTHYSAKNATLVVVGNFDPKVAKSAISDSFGDWSGGHLDKPVEAATVQRTGPEYIGVVQEKDAPQTEVAIAYPAPAGVDGEQAARMVMTEMLNIRMFQIRTELGSTYGTYARRTGNLGPNAVVMGGSIDTPRAGESIKVMRQKIQGLREGVDFDRDFATARRNVLKRLLSTSTVSGELANRLANIGRLGLQADYYDNLVKMVAAASPAQVKSLIARELKPENEVIVLKADRPSLEKTFADAGLTSVRLVEPN